MSGKVVGAALKLGVTVAIVAGAAAVAVATGVISSPFEETSSDSVSSTQIDYNCNLPGTGYPWLEHRAANMFAEIDAANGAGFFDSTVDDYRVFLPVHVLGNGSVASMEEVYPMLCRVHPQLGGGSGLRLAPDEEMRNLKWDFFQELPDRIPPEFYTDGLVRGSGTAHIAAESFNIYWLPEMSGGLLEALSGEPSSEPTPKPEETQRWQISIGGHELDEMNPYWRETTKVRGAVSFDYLLVAEFATRTVDAKRSFESAALTTATLDITTDYEPAEAWELRPLTCTKCNELHTARTIRGEVLPDGDLVLKWGIFQPIVQMEARIIASCLPMPGCAEWGSRRFSSPSFFEALNAQRITLKDGFSDNYSPPSSTPGAERVSFSYTITQLG